MKHILTLAILLSLAASLSAQKAKRGPDNAPKAGSDAPDLTLFRLADKEKKEPVKLSSFEGKKPVVLVFGSYT